MRELERVGYRSGVNRGQESAGEFVGLLGKGAHVEGLVLASLESRGRRVAQPCRSVTVRDSFFSGCSALGKGNDGNGGAVCVPYARPFPPSVELFRSGFVRCRASGSGGAVFSFGQRSFLQFLCFTSCSARSNSALYASSDDLTLDSSEFISPHLPSPSEECVGLGGHSISVVESNVSHVGCPGGLSFVRCKHTPVVRVSESVFSDSSSSIGFQTTGSRVSLVLEGCFVVNDTFSLGSLFSCDGATEARGCFIEVGSFSLCPEEDVLLLRFVGCSFNVPRGSLEVLRGIDYEGCVFGVTSLPGIAGTASDVFCAGIPPAAASANVGDPGLSSFFVEILMSEYIPLLSACFTGFCAVYLVRTWNDGGGRAPGVPESLLNAGERKDGDGWTIRESREGNSGRFMF